MSRNIKTFKINFDTETLFLSPLGGADNFQQQILLASLGRDS
jgi:hypothetical protein